MENPKKRVAEILGVKKVELNSFDEKDRRSENRCYCKKYACGRCLPVEQEAKVIN